MAAPSKLRRRSAAVMLAAIACLLLLAIVPMIPLPASWVGNKGQPPSWSTGAAVQASPSRMAFNIEQTVVLSRAPLLELERGKFSVQVGADGTADKRLVLENAVLRLEVGHGEVRPTPDVLSPLMSQLAALGMDRILLRGATVRFSDTTLSPIGPIDAEVDLTSRGQVGVRGVAVYFGDALSFEATAGNEAGATADGNERAAGNRRQVSVAIKGENLGEVRFEGELSNRNGLAGQMETQLASPAALMRWLGVPVRQAVALRNVSLGGRARWLDGMFDLQDARVTLDGQRPATGALRVRYRKGRPIIEGTLAFAALDLTRLSAAEESATATPQAAGQTSPLRGVLAAVTRDLPAYLDIDADLRLSASAVQLRGGLRGRGAATVTVDRGLLVAELADVEWAGNKARLHVSAGGQSWRPAFGVRGRVELVQAQEVLTPLLGQTLVAGPAILTLDLQGRGEGPNLLPGVMTGKLAVTSVAGTRSLLDPFKVAERTATKPSRDVPLLLSAPQTIEAMDLRLTLTDRTILVEPSQIRTPIGTARLSGQIDRSSAALDLVLARSMRARSGARAAEVPEHSFVITGSWATPNVARLALP